MLELQNKLTAARKETKLAFQVFKQRKDSVSLYIYKLEKIKRDAILNEIQKY